MRKSNRSRAEINKVLRQIFARHAVDLGSMSYTAGTSVITLSGVLIKLDGEEFTVPSIKSLADEIELVGSLTTDLANWEICGETIKRKANYYKKLQKAG